MDKLEGPIKALAEIGLWLWNPETMQEFYENIIAFEIMDDMIIRSFSRLHQAMQVIPRFWGCSISQYRPTAVRFNPSGEMPRF